MAHESGGQPSALIGIDDPRVAAVPIVECGEALQDVRSIAGVRMLPGFAEEPRCAFLVRIGVVERLVQAQAELRGRAQLLIAEGLRPLAAQRKLAERVRAEVAHAHPDWSLERVIAYAAVFVAPADDGAPHCSGAAVDLTLGDERGVPLPMGSALNEAVSQAYTGYGDLPAEVLRHRALLVEVMRAAGFVNYPAEWWHWSYGDRYWALVRQAPHARYGAVEKVAHLAVRLAVYGNGGR